MLPQVKHFIDGKDRYILELTILEGSIDLPYLRPGLSVETSIDGQVLNENRTSISKMTEGRAVWNKNVSFGFSVLEPITPVIVSMSMRRKRVLHQGLQLIGSAHFSISELIPILDKGAIQRKIKLNMAKGIPANGNITISLNLRSLVPEIFEADLTVPSLGEPIIVTGLSCRLADLMQSMSAYKQSISSRATVSAMPFCIVAFLLVATITCCATYQILLV